MILYIGAIPTEYTAVSLPTVVLDVGCLAAGPSTVYIHSSINKL